MPENAPFDLLVARYAFSRGIGSTIKATLLISTMVIEADSFVPASWSAVVVLITILINVVRVVMMVLVSVPTIFVDPLC